MAKLNQIIAIAQTKKSQAKAVQTEAYQLFQKPALFDGLVRQYTPKEDNGERLPPESKKVQLRADELIKKANEKIADMMDVVFQQDLANTEAAADITVDGKIIAAKVPATTLIFLEKQLNDLHSFVGAIPTLSADENWTKDENSNVYITSPVETHRQVKKQEPIVLYQATEQHPAQTQLITRDEIAGYWKTTKLSGGWTQVQKQETLNKVVKLREAIVLAREEANQVEASRNTIGGAVLGYIFGNSLV